MEIITVSDMKKQEYMKPAVRVVRVQQKYHLLGGSGEKVFGKQMSGGEQMSRQSDWGDWDDEE